MRRADIAGLIEKRLAASLPELLNRYQTSGAIAHVVIDDVLPEDLAHKLAAVFPQNEKLHFKSSLRERKYVSSQMNQHDALVEETLFAFHDPRIVKQMEHITGHAPLHADAMLYAGGISSMTQECFLNPHIDNSHDKDRVLWRALNLLYYISPGWHMEDGGHLELWPAGMKADPITIESKFNRLVVMQTHHESLHSVSKVHSPRARNCISNYYFSKRPMKDDQPFHVTSFRGRPDEPGRDMLLRLDAHFRHFLRLFKRGGFFKTGHWYKKN